MAEEMVEMELWITYNIPLRYKKEFVRDGREYSLSSFIESWMQFYESKITSGEDFDALLKEAQSVQNPSS